MTPVDNSALRVAVMCTVVTPALAPVSLPPWSHSHSPRCQGVPRKRTLIENSYKNSYLIPNAASGSKGWG